MQAADGEVVGDSSESCVASELAGPRDVLAVLSTHILSEYPAIARSIKEASDAAFPRGADTADRAHEHKLALDLAIARGRVAITHGAVAVCFALANGMQALRAWPGDSPDKDGNNVALPPADRALEQLLRSTHEVALVVMQRGKCGAIKFWEALKKTYMDNNGMQVSVH